MRLQSHREGTPIALLTLAQHKVFAGITTTDTTRDASLQEIIDEAISAVLEYCQNGTLELTQYTQILNLPSYPSLIVPFAPVTYAPDADTPIDFSLYVYNNARGDPSAFTSDHLLRPYIDYVLETGPTNITVSDSGIVRFLNGVWFINRDRPVYSLSTKIIPSYGAVKVVYTAGYATTPPMLRMVLNLIVRKIFNARKIGAPIVSESLNGYSYSTNSNITADGLITGDPTIQKSLRTFCRPQVGSYF